MKYAVEYQGDVCLFDDKESADAFASAVYSGRYEAMRVVDAPSFGPLYRVRFRNGRVIGCQRAKPAVYAKDCLLKPLECTGEDVVFNVESDDFYDAILQATKALEGLKNGA